MASKGRQFKDLMNAPEILIQPGIYDGYTARLIEHAIESTLQSGTVPMELGGAANCADITRATIQAISHQPSAISEKA